MATEPQGNPGRSKLGPSESLLAMFRACSRDPTEGIEARLRRMLDMFLQHHRNDAGNETNELARKCCSEARIWYYRILELLASRESNRPGIRDLSGIFEKDLLQSNLVACCLEITICSHPFPCDFPLLLQILRLAPYNFWRVIEPVLRADVGLRHPVRRHLAQVEEKVLESLAWTSESPLWEEIRANEGLFPTCQEVMPPTQLEDPTRADLQPDENLPGVGRSLGAERPGSTDQQRSPSADSRPPRSKPLRLFARKVYILMGKRLRELSSTLHISDELRLKIWACFEHSLVHCTDLMIDRHLDQLLMCAIYIIAKITNKEIPFKHIMNCYKSQPLANKSVCKNVLISGRDTENSLTGENNNGDHSAGLLTPNTPSTHYPTPGQEERGNLIYFYNEVYSTRIEGFAMQFAPTSGRDTPPLSPYPRQRKASPRPSRLSSCHSIFISPYNMETTTPHTPGLCYYFNSSPSERLREINNMIRTGRSPNRRGYAISFNRDEEEDKEDGPSAKRPRLDGQSAWQRRLRNVANERVTQLSAVTKPKLH